MQPGSSREVKFNPPQIMTLKEKEEYISNFNFPFCDESMKYEKVAKIGQGTFG